MVADYMFIIILGKIFVDFFKFLAQLPFTSSETELDYYRQKVYVRVAEQLKDLKCLELMASTQPSTLKANVDAL